MAMMVMNYGAEVFVPFPEQQEAGDYPVVLQCDEKHQSAGEVLAFPGPLFRADMQKDKVMTFIQEKRQECLLHLDEPQKLESYFFWSIMEIFGNSDESVMMSEIAALFFKGYSLLKKKLGRRKNRDQWCLPLAKLLCSALPEDQLREEIIKMGQDFASRKLTYPAHICFVLAQVELGSYKDYRMIGCKCLPQDKPDLIEILERTEVYEYVLSLTSGFDQARFLDLKCIYAFEIFELGRFDQALQYSKTIVAELIRCPSLADSDLLMAVEALCEILEQKSEDFEQQLKKLLQVEESQIVAPSRFHPSQHSEVSSRYGIRELLGEGGFGSVYAGVRKTDGKQVAIKCVAKDSSETYITIPGTTQSLPLEVALMVMVSRPYCENVVELLEWYETPEFFILVLERPDCCMDLNMYCYLNDKLSEDDCRTIMEQVVQAARHCCDRGVFHRDIKLENILITPSTLEVKLIDFGCGDLLKDEAYNIYIGTQAYCPPEWILYQRYFGVPATIWSLGIVLYYLVFGTLPFMSPLDIAEGKLNFPSDVSDECCMLIRWCLEHDPANRPTFEEILDHCWFTGELIE